MVDEQLYKHPDQTGKRDSWDPQILMWTDINVDKSISSITLVSCFILSLLIINSFLQYISMFMNISLLKFISILFYFLFV